MKINFHSHSHYSDGKKTVKELAKEINNAKIDYFALSDHDTPNGYHELKKLVKKTKLIPAIEITAKYDEDHFFHILGLNIDPIKMEKELMKYGEKYNVSFEKAFNRFTKQNKHLKLNLSDYKVRSKWVNPWYLKYESEKQGHDVSNKNWPGDMHSHGLGATLPEVIKIIHKCGGKAIWAHPFIIRNYIDEQIDLNFKEVAKYFKEILSYGIDGLEAYYIQFDKRQQQFLLDLANKNDLMVTVGTDFHGKTGQEKKRPLFLEVNDKIAKKIISDIYK